MTTNSKPYAFLHYLFSTTFLHIFPVFWTATYRAFLHFTFSFNGHASILLQCLLILVTLNSIKASKHINESMNIGGCQIFFGGSCKLSARISYCSFRKFARMKRKTAWLVRLQPPASPPPTLMNESIKKLLLGSLLFTLCVSEFETKPSFKTRKLKGIHLYALLIQNSATQTLYDIRIPVIMPFLSDHILSMK